MGYEDKALAAGLALASSTVASIVEVYELQLTCSELDRLERVVSELDGIAGRLRSGGVAVSCGDALAALVDVAGGDSRRLAG